MNYDLLNSQTDKEKLYIDNFFNIKNYNFSKENNDRTSPLIISSGKLHNELLNYIFNNIKSNKIFKNINDANYKLFLRNEISEYISLHNDNNLKKEDIYNSLSIVIELYENNSTKENIIFSTNFINYYLYNNIIVKILNLLNEFDSITFEQQTISIINNSSNQLNSVENAILQSFASVAIYSYYYWSQNINSWIEEYKKHNNSYPRQYQINGFIYADAAASLRSWWTLLIPPLNLAYAGYCSARYIIAYGPF